jgi:MscS family membrane protein
MKRKMCIGLCMVFLALLPAVFPQRALASVDSPLAPPDRSSPGTTLRSFLAHMNEGSRALLDARAIWDESPKIFTPPPEAAARLQTALGHFGRAMQCLDLSGVPEVIRDEKGRESILLLKEILDRIGLPPAESMTVPSGSSAGGWPPPSRWTLPGTEIQLYRVASGADEGRWLVSSESLSRLKGDYRKVKHMPYLQGAAVREDFYEEYLVRPGVFSTHKLMNMLPELAGAVVFGQALWQWGGLLLSLLLFAGALTAAMRLGRSFGEGRSAVVGGGLKLLPPVLLSLGAAWMILVVDRYINLSGAFCLFLVNLFTAVKWLGWSVSIFRLGDFLAELLILSPRIDPESIDASLVKTVGRLASIAAALAILAHGMASLGFSLATILTGFGVAGLAISLAARPTIENIIGGLTLFADRSVKIGEFCRFGGSSGTVLHIGLRSTKIQAFDHTILSIPNAEFSQMQIVNVSRRPDSLMEKRISLRYETTEDQLRWILASIRDLLHAHPMICADPTPFVRFENYGESSLNVLLFAYVKAKRWADRAAIEEDILFHVGKIVAKAGSGFAFPSTTAYIARDAGLDKEKGAEAEKEVRQWRESGLYPFPETPLERIAEVLGSVEYPPRG